MNKINVVVKHPIVVQLYLKLLYLLMLLELFVDVLINFVVSVLYHPCNVDVVDKNYVEVAVADVVVDFVDFVLLLKAVIIVVVLFGVMLFHILLVKYIYHQL